MSSQAESLKREIDLHERRLARWPEPRAPDLYLPPDSEWPPWPFVGLRDDDPRLAPTEPSLDREVA